MQWLLEAQKDSFKQSDVKDYLDNLFGSIPAQFFDQVSLKDLSEDVAEPALEGTKDVDDVIDSVGKAQAEPVAAPALEAKKGSKWRGLLSRRNSSGKEKRSGGKGGRSHGHASARGHAKHKKHGGKGR